MKTEACKEVSKQYFGRGFVLRTLYVLVIDTLIALFLTATGISPHFIESFVMAQS
jgi:hypothetical protein